MAKFTEASGIDNETELVEYRELGKGGTVYTHMVPGKSKWGQVTLKRGIVSDNSLWEWRQKVLDGSMVDARVDATLVGYASDNTTIIVAYSLHNCWPLKYQGPSFNAKGSETGIETLTLAHEGMERLL